jgi:hypothetical protein
MIWLLLPFTLIGLGISCYVLWVILSEFVRAARQSLRVCVVHVRAGGGERRRVTSREWWFAFRRELFRSYSSLVIRCIEIPHDPNKPMRPRLNG